MWLQCGHASYFHFPCTLHVFYVLAIHFLCKKWYSGLALLQRCCKHRMLNNNIDWKLVCNGNPASEMACFAYWSFCRSYSYNCWDWPLWKTSIVAQKLGLNSAVGPTYACCAWGGHYRHRLEGQGDNLPAEALINTFSQSVNPSWTKLNPLMISFMAMHTLISPSSKEKRHSYVVLRVLLLLKPE